MSRVPHSCLSPSSAPTQIVDLLLAHRALDTRTVAVVGTLTALGVSLLGVLLWRTRRTYPGFGRWTLGNLCAAAGLLFLIVRGVGGCRECGGVERRVVPSQRLPIGGHEGVRRIATPVFPCLCPGRLWHAGASVLSCRTQRPDDKDRRYSLFALDSWI
jgi:hypothetical protein